MSFRRVLVANRGEIACRVLRTLHTLGIPSATVYSEPDQGSPHVALADAATCVGPASAEQSYLDAEAVVAAAARLECDAVHPGYGFLSENPEFAEACEKAGLIFIGPSSQVIRQMGDKAAARRAAEKAGVPPVPGYHGDEADDLRLVKEAIGLGFPVMVKAARGGGGKGMRQVAGEADLQSDITAARREAQAAFGDDTLILEKYVYPARHVEVQVFGDEHGRVVSLLERECSLQRRHQKVIEECPSTAVDTDLRRRLGEAAVALASSVDYVGAGTVEFLLGEDGAFWFLEMNTRLQVEHGVTELVLGVDLVAWQLAVAAGDPLPAEAHLPTQRGHAIEARVYAEDPAAGFLPRTGLIESLVLPQGPGIRVDSGCVQGQEIGPHYDPLLMKILASGSDREEARKRLVAALRETTIAGLPTNVGWLARVLQDDLFRTGKTFTHTLETRGAPEEPQNLPDEVILLAAAALQGPAASARPADEAGDWFSPFDRAGAFRLVPGAPDP